MLIHGSLTLSFDAQQPYGFVSRAQWPDANYESCIREAVEEVLRERQGALDRTLVTLARIEWNTVSSSEIGFRKHQSETRTRRYHVTRPLRQRPLAASEEH
jgi:hypothetical protein